MVHCAGCVVCPAPPAACIHPGFTCRRSWEVVVVVEEGEEPLEVTVVRYAISTPSSEARTRNLHAYDVVWSSSSTTHALEEIQKDFHCPFARIVTPTQGACYAFSPCLASRDERGVSLPCCVQPLLTGTLTCILLGRWIAQVCVGQIVDSG